MLMKYAIPIMILACVAHSLTVQAEPDRTRPNIILIMVDDMG